MEQLQIPANFAASSTQYMSMIFTAFSSPITLIFGVLLGATAIGILISWLTKSK